MTDEKLPDPAQGAAKPASDKVDAPVQSAPDGAHESEPAAQQAVDQMLQDLMDDTDKAALYHLLSVC